MCYDKNINERELANCCMPGTNHDNLIEQNFTKFYF